MQQPDQATIDRIKNLALVGTALAERSNENTHQTKYYLAKEGLKNFAAGIDNLTLEPESAKGMRELIDYLAAKIDKRLDSSL